ncbi:Lectin BRA-3 [Amphibalanus amphitrite]|uniref:Lectin BRA-3 n=1 Tax=Amphibalanus amphitrite TaxID=1232801 RepID=A0A6A4VCZ2_AMPAM|nr:Lectin BRA-3 [Amphibalanus amphitrite]
MTSSGCACPAGFSRCAGRCLKRLEVEANFTEAESQCAAQGAHLAVPRSDEENQCAMNASGGVRVWLGLTDVITEGQFVGADGCGTVSSSSPHWAYNQPNDFKNQDFVCLVPFSDDPWNAGWQDHYPDEVMLALCQLPSCYQIDCP